MKEKLMALVGHTVAISYSNGSLLVGMLRHVANRVDLDIFYICKPTQDCDISTEEFMLSCVMTVCGNVVCLK